MVSEFKDSLCWKDGGLVWGSGAGEDSVLALVAACISQSHVRICHINEPSA